jgi:hypothetical protein
MTESTNGGEWFDKIKAVPTSLRTYALVLYGAYLKWGVPSIADDYVESLPDSVHATMKAQAWMSMSENLAIGGAVVIGAFVIAESIRGIILPSKRNKLVEKKTDA